MGQHRPSSGAPYAPPATGARAALAAAAQVERRARALCAVAAAAARAGVLAAQRIHVHGNVALCRPATTQQVEDVLNHYGDVGLGDEGGLEARLTVAVWTLGDGPARAR